MKYLDKNYHTQVDRLLYTQQPVNTIKKCSLYNNNKKYFLIILKIKLHRKLQELYEAGKDLNKLNVIAC